ncbi:MAG: hypothetical protein ACK4U0_17360 [Mesorhizobium sp.]
MTRAWAQTLTGRAVTLARPDARDIDPLVDMPEALARLCRFNGATPGGLYSVAQHCVLVSDAILDERDDAELAAHGLLHDAHEYLLGDITTPQIAAFAEIEAEIFPGTQIICGIVNEAKHRADEAIWRACGLPLPDEAQRRVVHGYDRRMLMMERRHMLAKPPKSWGADLERIAPLRLRGKIRAWPIAQAADAFRDRLIKLCPAVTRRAAMTGV